jgi:DNA polymerase elongation subunit (family B)
MNRVVFDIETLAYPFDRFDADQQAYLLKFAHSEEEKAEAIQRLSLTPFTARVIAIGMLNPDSNQGKVLYESPEHTSSYSEDGLVEFSPSGEEEMLREFWKTIAHYAQFITFNGRSFDCPFLLLRSAALGIKPSRNLMPYRYAWTEHCDLMEQLTFYGACRKFNLDFYCKAFGVKSPKANGITGLDLGRLFEERRFKEIAAYCLGDVQATAELFRRWVDYLGFER